MGNGLGETAAGSRGGGGGGGGGGKNGGTRTGDGSIDGKKMHGTRDW